MDTISKGTVLVNTSCTEEYVTVRVVDTIESSSNLLTAIISSFS